METLLSSSRSKQPTSSKLTPTDDSCRTTGSKNFRLHPSGIIAHPSRHPAHVSSAYHALSKETGHGVQTAAIGTAIDKHSLDSQSPVSSSCDDVDDPATASAGAIDEIPIWVHGEQRWISGIAKDTTCAQLVDALLRDQGLKNAPSTASTTTVAAVATAASLTADHLGNQYVITERWKRVEQVLDQRTRILKIWEAWGETRPEVRLCLRRVDHSKLSNGNHHHHHHQQIAAVAAAACADYDSGRESPTDGASSAIVRRKRHRTSKSSAAWVTHAQTIHPKSSKQTIEKLMKLILEQGETIQQQLTKLRDREHQITKLEEDRHHLRERKHGKNYLLETYLNGLHDADDKEMTTAGNSDSGVHTENATPSPEVSASPVHADEMAGECFDLADDAKALYANGTNTGVVEGGAGSRSVTIISSRRKTTSDREAKLLKEHESRKEFCNAQKESMDATAAVAVALASDGAVGGASSTNNIENDDNNVAGQIEMLEKVVAINKHIQREEELLVRLNAKIRKYESDNPALTEEEIMVALDRVNGDIAMANAEMEKMEYELDESNVVLTAKANIVGQLSRELDALELLSNGVSCEIDATNLVQIHSEPRPERDAAGPSTRAGNTRILAPLPPLQTPLLMSTTMPSPLTTTMQPPTMSQMNQPKQPPSASTTMNPQAIQTGHDNVLSEQINFYKNMLPNPNSFATTVGAVSSSIPPPPPPSHYIVPDHVIMSQVPRFFQKPDTNEMLINGGNLMQCRTDQRNINSNVATMAKCVKIGPKKLMMGLCKDAESDTGIGLLGDDATQLGTLV